MKEYDFTLKFRLSDTAENSEHYLKALEQAGCNDALVGIGRSGRIALNFCREAKSAFEAVTSAISNVKQAIPGIKLTEAAPDFVGITDIAAFLGFSRQYMRKLVISNGANFPEPVHEGKPSIWHLASVLRWFDQNQARKYQDELYELATTNMQLNVFKAYLNVAPSFGEGSQLQPMTPNKAVESDPQKLRAFVASLLGAPHG